MKKIRWLVVSKKGKNYENLFISNVGIGFTTQSKSAATPLALAPTTYLQVNGNRYFLAKELSGHIRRLHQWLKSKPQLVINEYRYFQKLMRQMQSFADTIPQNNFNQLNLISFLQKWSRALHPPLPYCYNYYFLDQETTRIILNALQKNKKNNIHRDFEILSQAKEPSVIQQEKTDLLSIMSIMKKNHWPMSHKKVRILLQKHLETYAFMGIYFLRGRPWRLSDIQKRLNDWQTKNWKYELKQLQKALRANEETKRLTTKLRLTSYEAKIVTLMKEMSHTTNRFDEVHNYFGYKSWNLLHYIAKKLSLTYVELLELSFTELLGLLKANEPISAKLRRILQQREKYSACLTVRGKTKILGLAAARKLFQREIGAEKITQKDVLHGQCACAGQAIGTVKIFNSVADIANVKKGNIMVAQATVPSFVPAMEKASAIVTEMGGLLSHAAIVSRELGIPCVIGVEHATKILKNIDRVEVDAERGVVRKL